MFFIAEAGVNHNGRLDLALELVERVAASGANAIKFQTFESARSVVAAEAPLAEYMTVSGGAESQEDLLEGLRLSFDDFAKIAEACAKCGIMFLSTPFDVTSVRFLTELGVRLLKTPSGEITNRFLLRAVAETGLPLIVSTGMADLDEIGAALDVIQGTWDEVGLAAAHKPWLAILHCVSSYPTPFEAVHLRAMETLRERFDCPVGFSDHTLGHAVPIAATALGARVIEKHVTLDTTMSGPDHAASLPLAELPGLICDIRAVEAALGRPEKKLRAVEADVHRVARRSLAAARDIDPGEIFEEGMLTALRPGTGISPMDLDRLIGRPARRGYRVGEIIDAIECGD